ncbi:hypothetical protein KFK09_026948 [Dendrobium nobile]|uniref:Uncharacterized protein n=1 Tax=Dendrobium nobile TaxID=94219 RepID=A0A8T3AA45_DENNO|nr:hypothetical protein KFK09_026948 [Dendrobium nobile]
MRREGRQHGTVMAYNIAPQKTGKKMPNQIDGPFMGIFSKVPSKPTNSSKYTSRCRVPRCGNCHDHPVNKARIKTKGNHRHKDEISDFYLKGGRNRAHEACEGSYDSDDSGESDGGEELVCQVGGGGGAGDCEEGEWVLCQGSGVVGGDCEHGEWLLVEGV